MSSRSMPGRARGSLLRAALLTAFLAALAALPGKALATPVDLTDIEKFDLERFGNIQLCVDPDWSPFEVINEQGRHEGIAADLLHLVAERTGLTFTLVPTRTWEESIEFSRTGRCQALSFLNDTPKRREWLSFSEPVFTDVNVFITREEHPFISDPGGLTGETLVLPKGTSIEEIVRREYPNIPIVTVESEADALRMVSEKKAHLTLRSLIMAAYTIKKEGWFNLKISGQLPEYTDKLRIGVSRERERLLPIINKGIRSISGQDRGAIVNRHISINVQRLTDYSLLYKVSGGLVLAILISTAWALQLRRHNRELARISQTDPLTGLANRNRLNAVLDQEHRRSLRTWRPLSVAIIDLDHFKLVNDDLGHLAGDKVLREIGALLREGVREIDIPGRWGGEEFLVVCPETDAEQAAVVADRIIASVAGHAFSIGRTQTVSIGVAALADGETLDDLLRRADTALYKAKNSGRNRRCTETAGVACAADQTGGPDQGL